MISATQLLARALGFPLNDGTEVCFYCGGNCNGSLRKSDFVRSTFNDWRLVAFPNSESICDGCAVAIREDTDVHLVDGTARTGQRMRNYSWIIGPGLALAATKANLDYLRATCLTPPEPPFAITLATSGQKQLIFRSPVNWERETIEVQLEEERVAYQPSKLADRLRLCSQLAAAIGKPALSDTLNAGHVFRVADYYPDYDLLLDQWQAVSGEPLTRLAVFLCPPSAACKEIYHAAKR